jgi:hypothetical protein
MMAPRVPRKIQCPQRVKRKGLALRSSFTNRYAGKDGVGGNGGLKRRADAQDGENDMKGGGQTRLDSGNQNDIHGCLSKCMVVA